MSNPLDFAEKLAQKAGETLIQYFRLEGVDADLKEDRTIVTKADLAADTLIRQEIEGAYPQDMVLTEETNQIEFNPDRPLWVIDPLDGTTNFSLGLHTWGVSVARLVAGYPEIAVLYFPLFQELYSARHGQGATLNHQPLSINPRHTQQSTSFFACCSRTMRKYNVTLRYKTRILGSAAYDFCIVARGAAIAGFQATTKIWDIAAGWLLVEEAGGTVELYGGGSPFPYLPQGEYINKTYPTMISANPSIAEKLRTGIKKRPEK